jgi:hypothetical protein
MIIPVVPEIELLDIGPSTVVAHQDSIGFQIRYTDGDGDLGTNDDTQRNLFVIDNRINATHAFRLQQLAPDGAEIPITGTFRFSLPYTIITDGSQEQNLTFTLYLVDRAGHESNRIESPMITVIE